MYSAISSTLFLYGLVNMADASSVQEKLTGFGRVLASAPAGSVVSSHNVSSSAYKVSVSSSPAASSSFSIESFATSSSV